MKRRESYSNSKTGGDRWLVSYADFITLLFGFFLVMYSVSQVNESKYETLSSTLAQTFLSDETASKKYNETDDLSIQEALDSVEAVHLSELSSATEVLAHQVNRQLLETVGEENMTVDYKDSSLEITLDSSTLFKSAQATLSKQSLTALENIANLLSGMQGQIEVAGHTDNLPINTQQFKNNWDLSSARAVAVVQRLIVNGIAPDQLSAVGFGEYQPIADNSDLEGRKKNRRVVLSVNLTQGSLGPSDAENVNVDTLDKHGKESGTDSALVLPISSSTETSSEKAPSDTGETATAIEQNTVASDDVSQENGKSLPVTVPPVELKNGGLLFTSDPNLPRKVYR